MKTKIPALLAVALALALAPTLAPPACAELVTNSVNVPTAFLTVTNTTVTSTAGTAFAVPQNSALNLAIGFVSYTTVTGTLTVGFDVYDGNQWTTDAPFKVSGTINGSTAVVTHTNIAASALTGLQSIRLGYATTTNAIGVAVGTITIGYWR